MPDDLLRPEEVGELKYDCALACAVLLINCFDSSPGASKPELLSIATYAVLEAITEYQRRCAPSAFATSDN